VVSVHSLSILLANYLIVLIILQDQKKFHEQLTTEKGALFGSRPSPARPQGSKKVSGLRANSNATNGCTGKQLALNQNGSRTASRNGQRSAARPSAPVNYVAIAKDDVASHVSSNNPSVSGSP
jgi:Ase1/PRC1/MAP65 family protein